MSTSELILSPLSSRLCGIVYGSHIFKRLSNHRTFTEVSSAGDLYAVSEFELDQYFLHRF